MAVDFEAARELVAGAAEVRSVFPAGDFMVGEYGWESDTEFRIVAGTRRDVTGEGDVGSLTFDTPTILVDKTSGAVRLVYWHRLIDANPMAGMTPIGAAPA